MAIGSKARDAYSHKTYSVLKESLELFVAEGTVTDYVLESYERGYLSFLITMALVNLQRTDQVTAELNRFYNEEVAATYNHGQDPVNALLQATLWDNFPREGYSSRPFWLWLSKSPQSSSELRYFAANRVKNIDLKSSTPSWHIAAVGNFPELDWSLKFTDSSNGFLAVKPTTPFIATCSDPSSIVVPTNTWFKKIAIRHSNSYHPLVNAKTWIRMPVGIIYGISTVVAGAGIAVGGCTADVSMDVKGALCQLSLRGGVAVMASSGDVVKSTVRPDLRHWEAIPEAIVITNDQKGINRDSDGQSACLKTIKQRTVTPLFAPS
ncbi:MAG: hypothetical protein FJ146_12755 [Deltaproteobacteria bacterium]|nr:hypothetical protein [Deltaproteobacteria bacterium]